MLYPFTGAITDGRLTVGITKLDLIDSHETGIEEVRKITIQSIEEATGLKISNDMVVPLSGKWAMAGSKLGKCLKGVHHSHTAAVMGEVLSILEANHSQLDVPCGQGESIKECLKSRFDSPTLVQMLEKVSGVEALKERFVQYLMCISSRNKCSKTC